MEAANGIVGNGVVDSDLVLHSVEDGHGDDHCNTMMAEVVRSCNAVEDTDHGKVVAVDRTLVVEDPGSSGESGNWAFSWVEEVASHRPD